MAATREKALDQIVSLQRVVERPGTVAEGEAAQRRIDALRLKWDIPAPQTGPTQREKDEAERVAKLRRDAERAWAKADAERKRKAQEDWKRKQAENDDLGRPLTEAEKAEARRDPLGWAAKRDKRTQAQKQADMNASRGKQDNHRPWAPGPEPRCANPESFFDQGGNPRIRNMHITTCDRCGRRLMPGEGTVMKVGPVWVGRCCETKPGPRKKRDFDQERDQARRRR